MESKNLDLPRKVVNNFGGWFRDPKKLIPDFSGEAWAPVGNLYV